ncbi:subtilisin-like protease sbt1.8 [Quercus suber]|uniref:Subtilisin-like protease sbt1.8 n=1 Tax=Quercus suber TaxID=58331 RepID=A0AAW0KLF7_QUESU
MAVAVGRKAGDLIKEYVRSNPNPTALLTLGGTLLDVRPPPVVAMFSSRGQYGDFANLEAGCDWAWC